MLNAMRNIAMYPAFCDLNWNLRIQMLLFGILQQPVPLVQRGHFNSRSISALKCILQRIALKCNNVVMYNEMQCSLKH